MTKVFLHWAEEFFQRGSLKNLSKTAQRGFSVCRRPCNVTYLVGIAKLNYKLITWDTIGSAYFFSIFLEKFVNFDWCFWSLKISSDHFWVKLFKLTSNLSGHHGNLFENSIILFFNLLIDFNDLISF